MASATGTAVLAMKPPAARGVPEQRDWEQYVRAVELRAESARRAIAQFDNGELDLVLGGRPGSIAGEVVVADPTGAVARLVVAGVADENTKALVEEVATACV